MSKLAIYERSRPYDGKLGYLQQMQEGATLRRMRSKKVGACQLCNGVDKDCYCLVLTMAASGCTIDGNSFVCQKSKPQSRRISTHKESWQLKQADKSITAALPQHFLELKPLCKFPVSLTF